MAKKTTKKTAKKATKKTTGKAKTTAKKATKKTTMKAAAKTAKPAKKTATKKMATKKTTAKMTTKPATKTAPKTKPTMSAKAVTSKPAALPKAQVTVGAPVPNFEAPATGNKNFSLESVRGKNVVLFFYPKDKTPGCTLEGHEFTKLQNDFNSANTEVLGVSRDTMKLHEDFKECEKYSIDLLSDEDEKLCSIFGVIKNKNMYGKQVRGIERSTFVIDANGNLVKEWRGVSVPGHAEEVLNFIKTLT
jgi:peroxiredoxin Q/BCP